jgi:phage terminase small subunit
MSEKALTDRQRLFADFYIGEGSLNATRSARLAGYKGDENSLAAQGSRLLRNVKVRAYIDDQLKDLTLSASEVLTILTKQAKASLADVLDDRGMLDLAEARKRGVDGLLKKLKIRADKDGMSYEYEMYDAQAAAVHIGKVHKLFTDKTEITGKDGGPVEQKYVVEVVNDSNGPGKKNTNK